ncbi:hypothetical protein [Actinoplanes sp. N902-109]|uniref:WXG100-like domain-containing protein n=1 Tax=Actinoplanes sp. (strain N902-109) TaxID=649831 RepID=UPI0003293C5F|nr:hypothetical protein [Actinoplanes sp. N902-109]AGL15609.1 hypothetical protein L083_2099 [Actinoplanes sp. N902-109]
MSTNPLVAAPQDSTRWYTGLGLAEDAADISTGIHDNSWVDGTLGGVGGTLDMLSLAVDPLGTLVSWGVSWLMEHVKPLKEALDWLAGNADEVAAHAATWQNVATFTAQAAQDYSARLGAEVSSWFGASGDAYREHAGGHIKILEGLAAAAGGISYAVEGAGLLVALVRGIVRDLIADFVGTLAVRLPQWLAEEGLTLGIATPVVVSQVSALVAKWVNKIQHFVRALLRSLHRLNPKLGKLGEVLTGLKRYADELAEGDVTPGHGGSGDGGPGVPSPRGGWHEGDPIPPPLDGGGVPTDAKLKDRYRNESDPDAVWPFDTPFKTPVHYFDESERESYRLFVDGDGRLRSAESGDLFDTTQASTIHSGEGRAIFVMDGNGNLYATTNHRPGLIHHSSLLAGGDVAGAGEIKVVDGQLVEFTDRSGHYQPRPEVNDQALAALREQGLRTTDDFQQFDHDNQVR